MSLSCTWTAGTRVPGLPEVEYQNGIEGLRGRVHGGRRVRIPVGVGGHDCESCFNPRATLLLALATSGVQQEGGLIPREEKSEGRTPDTQDK